MRALATEQVSRACLFAEKEEQRKGVNDDFHKDKKKIVANLMKFATTWRAEQESSLNRVRTGVCTSALEKFPALRR